jgi:hypothetical protein
MVAFAMTVEYRLRFVRDDPPSERLVRLPVNSWQAPIRRGNGRSDAGSAMIHTPARGPSTVSSADCAYAFSSPVVWGQAAASGVGMGAPLRRASCTSTR